MFSATDDSITIRKPRWFGSRRARTLTVGLIGVTLTVLLGAGSCDDEKPPKNNAQQSQQEVTNKYMEAATAAVPYPLSAMQSGGWLERTLLKENLLRQNNAHRRAFVTLMNTAGQPIMQFPIQGMVFDLNSQMTTTDMVNNYRNGQYYGYSTVTQAAGDNGTWGPEP